MTQVILHGILAKEFRKNFSFAIKRPKEVFDAISCSHNNFRSRLVELANQGVHFALLINGKKINAIEDLSIALNDSKIDIVPFVCGHGPQFVPFIIAAVVAAAKATAAYIVANAAYIAITIALFAVQMMLAPKPKVERPESAVNSAQQSFIYASKANVAEQGIPVPVGYGRLRVGSAVIQSTIKSYPRGLEKEIALKSDGNPLTNDRL